MCCRTRNSTRATAVPPRTALTKCWLLPGLHFSLPSSTTRFFAPFSVLVVPFEQVRTHTETTSTVESCYLYALGAGILGRFMTKVEGFSPAYPLQRRSRLASVILLSHSPPWSPVLVPCTLALYPPPPITPDTRGFRRRSGSCRVQRVRG